MDSTQGSCQQNDPDLQVMIAGTNLRKVKSHSSKKKHKFRLVLEELQIRYKSGWARRDYHTVSVSELEAVREGHQSEVLKSVANEFPANHCFTVELRGRKGNLNLVAGSPNEARAWIQGLRKLITKSKTMEEKDRLHTWVCEWFKKADKNHDGQMNFKEVQRLLKLMNIEMQATKVFQLFTEANKSNSSTLKMEEFFQFYKILTRREEVLKIFQEYSSDGEKLTLDELAKFLSQKQQEADSVLCAQQLIEHYETSEAAKAEKTMSYDGFQMYLRSLDGSVIKPKCLELHEDMTQPLSHYYMSSSHNTYLMEDQLRGHSSVEAYIMAFKRGCRCVEIDCWDGSDGEPVVYHGHTLTSKILFKDVIDAIKMYAFKTSEFPVVLSLENHCSVEQQNVMARHLDNILGDTLLQDPLNGQVPRVLPSPQELKGKILLKSKKIGGLEDENDDLIGEVSDEEEIEEDAESYSAEINSAESNSAEHHSKKTKSQMSRELSNQVVYCKSVHFKSFEDARLNGKCYEISSFSESKSKKLIKEEGTGFVQHNTRQMSRIYPSGMRTGSSNYNPNEYWNAGCQIVALNFQTAGLEMDLNDGLFRQNGGCGYVLKPAFLRDRETTFNPECPETHKSYTKVNFSVQVISGQQLPKVNQKESSIADPLVRVEVYGVPQDHQKAETHHINNNGFNPVWNTKLDFIIHVPELALVRFEVEDYDKASKNDFLGQYTLPFTCIQKGYRHIHLLSKDGTPIPEASLFVYINFT